MPKREVEVNSPGWLDLASPDVEAAKRFYSELFGWYFYTLTVPGYGDYTVFTLGHDGPEVAGLQALADDSEPPSWTCYFRVDDLQAATETVKAAGGQELISPTDYGGVGQMALCTDSQGADFGVALPGIIPGAPVGDEPSTMCWVELACRDIQDARRFYGEVFGWRAVDRDYYGSVYTNWKIGDRPVAGMVAMDDAWPPHYPAHWIPYVWVEDCDASAARAADLGARIRIPPTDVAPGRYSMLTDPTGARLAIITPAPR